MDTVDNTGANVQLMKGIQHLPNWKLIIPLLLLTSYTACDISTPSSVPDSSDQNMTVITYVGGTASFPWSCDVQPFYAIEWFFGDKLIADTTVKSFSKDDISINPNYADRFHLQTAGNVGFSLTDVTKNDTGTYSCVVTLKSTDIPEEFTRKLQVKDSSETVTCCRGNASFTWNYTLLPFTAIEWYVNDTQIAETTDPSFSQDVLHINGDYNRRFRLHKIGDIGFNITDVTEADEGDYRCLVTLRDDGILNALKKKLQVDEITLGDYNITVTNTTEDCWTLKCGEPVGTNTKYKWSIRVNGTDEKPNRITTNTFKFCLKAFKFSVKCQRDYDCTETTWTCFKTGQPGSRRQKRRTLDEQLVPCGEDTDSGNQDDSSPNTTGIAVAVVFAVIAVIAISTVVIWRILKSRTGRRSDSFKVEAPANTACLELVVKTHQPEEKSDDELEELKDNKHL